MLQEKVWKIFLLCCLTAVNGQTACSPLNGECSDQCIDRGDRSVQCGCPCGETLAADNKTCVPHFLCDLDVYIAVDRSRNIAPVGCGRRPSSDFLDWQAVVVAVLKLFEEDAATSAINVGVQIYSRQTSSSLVTAANYIGSPNLTDAIATYAGYTQNDCGPSGSYSRFLFFAGESSSFAESLNVTYVPLGPSSLRSKFNTSRVAIALALRPSPSTTDELLRIYRNNILENFDSIIVITKTHGNQFYENEEENGRQARLLACGSPEKNCGNVFWVDKVNDLGIPFNYRSIHDRANRSACLYRRPGGSSKPEPTVTSCDVAMIFEIPLCTLVGLNALDLIFYNSTCSVASYSSVVNGTIVVNLGYGQCGMMEEMVIVDGVVRKRHTIRVVNMHDINNISVHVFNVNLVVSCTVATFSEPVSLSIKPAELTVTKNLSRSSTYPLEMELFPYNNFTMPFVPSITIKVGCTVFMEAKSILLPNLCLRFWSCWATPSGNPQDQSHHTLADYGCPKDPTFKILPPPFNNVARASFEMFQFVSGYKKPKDQKPRVFIHCKFVICQKGYNSSSCNPNCGPVRRRRAITDESNEQSVMKSIGPFTLDDGDVEKEKVRGDEDLSVGRMQDKGNNAEENPEIYRHLKIVIPLSAWSINFILYWANWISFMSFVVYMVWSVKWRHAHIHDKVNGTLYAEKLVYRSEAEKSSMKQSKQSNSIESLPPYTA